MGEQNVVVVALPNYVSFLLTTFMVVGPKWQENYEYGEGMSTFTYVSRVTLLVIKYYVSIAIMPNILARASA